MVVIAARRAPPAKSYELWRGPSLVDDRPVVAIASCVGARSLNPKTGEAVQVYFLRADASPVDAVRARDARPICGECIHAPHRDATCYVNPAFGAQQLWLSWRRGDCPPLDRRHWPAVFRSRFVRLGAYGDPCCAPPWLSAEVAAAAGGHAAYTQAWRERADLRAIAMASVTSDAERREAEALGWRAFQVVPTDPRTLRHLEPVAKGVVVCAASAERGKRTTCVACRACAGLASKARASIAIGSHGSVAFRFAGVRGLGRDAPRYPGEAEAADALPLGSAWGAAP